MGVLGADFEEMAVRPAQSGLQGQMQTIEPDVERNFDPTQNFRLHIVERDFEADNGGHAASLRGFAHLPSSIRMDPQTRVRGGSRAPTETGVAPRDKAELDLRGRGC